MRVLGERRGIVLLPVIKESREILKMSDKYFTAAEADDEKYLKEVR
jgi:hypothetical protein